MQRVRACYRMLSDKIGIIIGAVFLGIYPFCQINRGVDLMDAGYGLGNFYFFKDMDLNWKLATYLSNILGSVLLHFPGASTYLGMNFYTTALLVAAAITCYLFLIKIRLHPVLVFLGEWIALSLCWAPTTILYHYLGYYLITLAVICIELAIGKRNKKCYFLAGILLGAGIFVRMPNVTYMACILVVWFDALFLYEKTDKWKRLFRNTGICIMGYLVGAGVPFAIICHKYKFQAYIVMIQWLFGMTETATDYKPTSMIYAMFGDYIQYAVWLGLMLLYVLAGLLLFRIRSGQWEKAKKICFLLGLPVLLRFFYGRGMFGFDYNSYFSIYKWLVVFLLLFWMATVWFLSLSEDKLQEMGFERAQADRIKRITVGAMVIVMITPLGSNNGLYPIINNLFLPAPLTLYLGFLFVKRHQHFPIKAMACTIAGAILLQTTMFGTHFVFHDAVAGQKIDTEITQIPSLRHMRTTAEKAQELESLYQYISCNKLQNRPILLYGDIPALSYILRMKPAIFTTWADLASNTQKQLVQAMYQLDNKLKSAKKQERPLVIVSAKVGAYLTDDAEGMKLSVLQDGEYESDGKIQIIKAFLEAHAYSNTYCNTAFLVFE